MWMIFGQILDVGFRDLEANIFSPPRAFMDLVASIGQSNSIAVLVRASCIDGSRFLDSAVQTDFRLLKHGIYFWNHSSLNQNWTLVMEFFLFK